MAMSSLAAGVGGLFWLDISHYIQPSNISSALSLWFCYFFFAQLLGKIGNFMAMSSLAAGVGGLFWLETNIQLSRSLLEKLNMMSFIEN